MGRRSGRVRAVKPIRESANPLVRAAKGCERAVLGEKRRRRTAKAARNPPRRSPNDDFCKFLATTKRGGGFCDKIKRNRESEIFRENENGRFRLGSDRRGKPSRFYHHPRSPSGILDRHSERYNICEGGNPRRRRQRRGDRTSADGRDYKRHSAPSPRT